MKIGRAMGLGSRTGKELGGGWNYYIEEAKPP